MVWKKIFIVATILLYSGLVYAQELVFSAIASSAVVGTESRFQITYQIVFSHPILSLLW
jgi:hypothetical protein